MIVRSAARSDVGRRRAQNEDRFLVDEPLGLFLVADGMGGHNAGQRASEIAVEAARRAVAAPRAGSLSERLRQALADANHAVWDAARGDPDLAGMGTTAVALLVEDARAALAHVGDSRAYLLRAGALRQLTHDHSLVAELVRRHELSESAARAHPHRHVLTRALGVRPDAAPDLAELELGEGDRFLLCSDGLTAHVDDGELAGHAAGEGDPDGVCEALVDLANARGGEDNVTVVLVRCEKGD